jgi:exo-1,4-beta-D-glucosaminidase
VTPITYTDNYVTLFPGDSVRLTARYSSADLGGQTPFLKVHGYNVPSFTATVAAVNEGAASPP